MGAVCERQTLFYCIIGRRPWHTGNRRGGILFRVLRFPPAGAPVVPWALNGPGILSLEELKRKADGYIGKNAPWRVDTAGRSRVPGHRRVDHEGLPHHRRVNAGYHDAAETRAGMSELTGQEIDETTWIVPPFYTDFGRFTRFGRDAFVNCGCTFMDCGGITVGDGVLIGPEVKLITENHAEEPELRRHVYGRPIVIGRRAWIGAGLPFYPA